MKKMGGDIQDREALYIPPRKGKLMNVLQAAYRYLDQGLAVIPVWRDRRKNPHLTSYTEYLKRLPSRGEWARWAKRWPSANIGAITGYWLNYVALDFDNAQAFVLWADGPGFELVGRTWQIATGRGFHVWFQLARDPGKSQMYVKDGQEVLLRAKGGYCIVPPSVHHTGTKYRTTHNVLPLTVGSVDDILDGWELKSREISVKPILPVNVRGVRLEQMIEPIGKPNGRGAYQAFCPFHNDSRPSAWVNIEQQRFGCNACWPGMWWDVVNVYAMIKGITNREAYKELKGGG